MRWWRGPLQPPVPVAWVPATDNPLDCRVGMWAILPTGHTRLQAGKALRCCRGMGGWKLKPHRCSSSSAEEVCAPGWWLAPLLFVLTQQQQQQPQVDQASGTSFDRQAVADKHQDARCCEHHPHVAR